MSRHNGRLDLTIDGRALEVEPGLTILDAARRNGIYIPTLCFHESLSRFGGCRLCIVEVEGMRSFPTACTTPVEDGMTIRTHTAQVQAVRAEVLQLILSEHPASCLVCDEREECRTFMGTIRKAGVTTGCRYCPSDGGCELQQLARDLGVSDIHYPVSYRNLDVEKDDPFYDRDYNLCILCGRCVRMCQEVRAAGTLAFKQRGNRTIIGPAFSRTHLEAGCEFCGACVDVCPTGALAEKTRKWEGQAESEQLTTCLLCGIGCQLRLQAKDSSVLGALPADGVAPSRGQLCVKGRFCIPELVNHHTRLLRPRTVTNGTPVELAWDEAVALAAEKISGCAPGRFRMLASPDCSNEDLYIAAKFARVAARSNDIDGGAGSFYGASLPAYLRLLPLAVPLAHVEGASVVLGVGLDTRYGRSVVGVALRRAVDRGTKLITVHPLDHNLALIADRWLRPGWGEEAEMVARLADLTDRAARPSGSAAGKSSGDGADELAAAAELLAAATSPVVIVGPDLLHHGDAGRLLEEIARLAGNIGAGVVALPAFGNLVGSVLMGADATLLPGGHAAADPNRAAALVARWGTSLPTPSPDAGEAEVLYLVGAAPPPAAPRAAFVISHSIYVPGSPGEVDLALPAAAFTEVDGSVVNGERRVLRLRRVVEPPGEALPDWEILCRIARAIGARGFDFASARDVHDEIASLVEGFGDFEHPGEVAVPFRCGGVAAPPRVRAAAAGGPKLPYTLTISHTEHAYRGTTLASRVGGASRLFAEGVLAINPEDAEAAGISGDDRVVVTGAHFERTWTALTVPTQPRGVLGVTLAPGDLLGVNPGGVRVRRQDA